MPRIRTLKPDHRQHRKVGPLDHVTYRLWVGMILEADDEGRLVCDTEQLRVTIFGYHPRVTGALIESSLSRLDKAGLVQLYAMGGLRYAWFPSWRDHQVINRPTPSRLPPYEDSLSDPGGLIEDSLLKGREGNEGNGRESNPSPLDEEAVWPSPKELVKLYNAQAPDECPAVTVLSPSRRKKAAAYLTMFPDRKFWEEVCAQIGASRFLRGLRPSNGHERFVADFDWLLTKGKDGSENAVKVYEGKYHD